MPAFDEKGRPVLNAPIEIFDAFVMATFVCRCQEGNPPMLIRGTDQIVACDKCLKAFAIAKCGFDHTKMQVPQVFLKHVANVDPQTRQLVPLTGIVGVSIQ